MSLTPYIAVSDARAAIDWYVAHLGARVTFDPIVMPDGRVGHSELTISTSHGDATLMLSDEHPEIQVEAPQPDRGNAVTLHLEVDDVDGVVESMVRGGAVLDRAPEDNPVGRVAVVRDPFGHRWFLNQPAAARTP